MTYFLPSNSQALKHDGLAQRMTSVYRIGAFNGFDANDTNKQTVTAS
jgi:hypothetical protein